MSFLFLGIPISTGKSVTVYCAVEFFMTVFAHGSNETVFRDLVYDWDEVFGFMIAGLMSAMVSGDWWWDFGISGFGDDCYFAHGV